MTYTFGLQDKYYDYILKGTKRVEIRLYDEKRQKIKVGDTILFTRSKDVNETFEVVVNKLVRYPSFIELFNDYDIALLASENESKENLLKDLEVFYDKSKQAKYGVLAILFELKEK